MMFSLVRTVIKRVSERHRWKEEVHRNAKIVLGWDQCGRHHPIHVGVIWMSRVEQLAVHNGDGVPGFIEYPPIRYHAERMFLGPLLQGPSLARDCQPPMAEVPNEPQHLVTF
jgi:hypothetical protein